MEKRRPENACKRYVKVRLKNGFIYYNTYGLKPQSHVVRAHRHTVFAGAPPPALLA